MKRCKCSAKKIAAIALCCLLMINFGFVQFNTSTKAADASDGKAQIYDVAWFKSESDKRWFDNNSGMNMTDKDGPFLINHPNGKWQYFYRWGGNGSQRIDCNGPDIIFDLDDANTITYNFKNTKPMDLFIQAYTLDENDQYVDGVSKRHFLKLQSLQAGENKGSYDLRDNSEFKKLLNKNNKIMVSGICFQPTGLVYGDTIDVLDFAFELKDKPSLPVWFRPESDTKWWDGNCFGGLNGPDGGFLINHPDGNWQYFHRWSQTGGTARLDCNGPGAITDLDEINTLKYTIKSSKPIDLCIQVYNLDDNDTPKDRHFITLESFRAGTHTGSYDLRANEEFMKLLNSQNKFKLEGISFQTNGFAYGDTIDVSSFELSLNPNPYVRPEPVQSWIVNATDNNWWSWDWNFATGSEPIRLTADYSEKGPITVHFNGDFRDLKFMGDTLTADLKETPYLYIDITSGFKFNLYLLITGRDNNGIKLEENIEAGNYNKRFDIANNEILKKYVSNNKFSAFGFRIEPLENPNRKDIVFKAFDFGKENSDFTGDRPVAPEITIDTQDKVPQVNVTVTAPKNAAKVQYRIGSNGTWNEYTKPVVVSKNVAVYARYVTTDDQWSLSSKLQITNISSGQSEDVKPVIPIWLNKGEEDTCWYNWDWNHNKNDENRFKITYPNGIWTAEIGQEWVTRLETQHNGNKYPVKINLNEHTELFYKIDSQFASNISLKVGTPNGSYATVKLGAIAKGRTSGSLNLSQNPELLALSDDNNNLLVKGIIIDGFSPRVGDTIAIERLIFDTESAYYEGYPDEYSQVKEIWVDWFNAKNIKNWITGGVVEINKDNDWCYTVKDVANANASYSAAPVKPHLKSANTLFTKVRSDFDADMQLIVRFKGDDHNVKVCDINKGKNFIKLDLNTVSEIVALSNNGSLQIKGVVFVPKQAKSGEQLKVDLFAFNKGSFIYPDYEDEAAIAEAKKQAAEVDKLILAIGEVTLDKEQAILKARESYEALTNEARYYVCHVDVLINAENELRQLKENSGIISDNHISESEIIEYMQENNGTMVDLHLKKAVMLSPEILAAAKNYNCDIRVSIYSKNDEELIYSVLLQSESMTDTSAPFDPTLYTDLSKIGVNANAVANLIKGKNAVTLGMSAKNRIESIVTVAFASQDSFIKLSSNTISVAMLRGNGGKMLINNREVENDKILFRVSGGNVYIVSEDSVSDIFKGVDINSPATGQTQDNWVIYAIMMLLPVLFAFKKEKGNES